MLCPVLTAWRRLGSEPCWVRRERGKGTAEMVGEAQTKMPEDLPARRSAFRAAALAAFSLPAACGSSGDPGNNMAANEAAAPGGNQAAATGNEAAAADRELAVEA